MRELPDNFKGHSVNLDGHAEMRDASRSTPLIRTAKLVLDGGEYLCVLRDVSATGVSVRLFHELPPSQSICLEMPDGDCFDITLVWSDSDRAGFQFVEPIDVKLLVSNHGAHPKRALRVNLSHAAVVKHYGHTNRVQLTNISQHGACIESEEFMSLDERIDLQSEYLAEMNCTVRWRKEPHYGVCFGRTLAFAELAAIVEAVNRDQLPNSSKPNLRMFSI